MRKCCTCSKVKPLEEFFRDKSKAQGRGYKCKECQIAYNREYGKGNGFKYQKKSNKVNGHSGWTPYRQAQHEKRKRLITESSVDIIDRKAVWERDEGHCQLRLECSGEFVPFLDMHMDHIVPLARGGTHTWDNVQTSCAPCNLVKGTAVEPDRK
jgi:5-methylcytosine-specific restriction endonuclease McrA